MLFFTWNLGAASGCMVVFITPAVAVQELRDSHLQGLRTCVQGAPPSTRSSSGGWLLVVTFFFLRHSCILTVPYISTSGTCPEICR